ncbi:MAG: hypothetical protein PHD36_02870 [Desulfotomaculaceae bacterium]|nr:hypothetical protein [Desulfotomaculaceae bacterium]
MAKVLREGASYNQRDIMDLLGEFSAFKDRVEKKFNTLARELDGKINEHDLWVNLYLVSTDYAEETIGKRHKQQEAAAVQKVS